jgi:hypothetical protein
VRRQRAARTLLIYGVAQQFFSKERIAARTTSYVFDCSARERTAVIAKSARQQSDELHAAKRFQP